MSKPIRKYTMEFKEEAMKLMERGYTQRAAVERLGIDARRLSDWLCRGSASGQRGWQPTEMKRRRQS